jgi:hypothetical protein
MYQLRKKILPTVLPSMVEAENFQTTHVYANYDKIHTNYTGCVLMFPGTGIQKLHVWGVCSNVEEL